MNSLMSWKKEQEEEKTREKELVTSDVLDPWSLPQMTIEQGKGGNGMC